MIMIEEAYVNFDTAVLLKEKGFEQIGCQKVYNLEGQLVVGTAYGPAAPTQQMAMRYLREVHDIIIGVSPHMLEDKTFQYSIYKDWIWESSLGRFDSYEKACEAAIKYSLKHLI